MGVVGVVVVGGPVRQVAAAGGVEVVQVGRAAVDGEIDAGVGEVEAARCGGGVAEEIVGHVGGIPAERETVQAGNSPHDFGDFVLGEADEVDLSGHGAIGRVEGK